MYDKSLYLIAIEEEEDTNEYGSIVKNDPIKRLVYVDVKSIRQSEFYQAQAVGMKPELMFEIRSTEYKGERKCEYKGQNYDVIRIFKKNNDFTEIICTKVAHEVV